MARSRLRRRSAPAGTLSLLGHACSTTHTIRSFYTTGRHAYVPQVHNTIAGLNCAAAAAGAAARLLEEVWKATTEAVHCLRASG